MLRLLPPPTMAILTLWLTKDCIGARAWTEEPNRDPESGIFYGGEALALDDEFTADWPDGLCKPAYLKNLIGRHHEKDQQQN